jgi:hypothetical protein
MSIGCAQNSHEVGFCGIWEAGGKGKDYAKRGRDMAVGVTPMYGTSQRPHLRDLTLWLLLRTMPPTRAERHTGN